MPVTTKILLAEDSEQDIELTLTALKECHLANRVDVVRDGAEALDYLHRRGEFAGLTGDLPIVVLLDLKMPKIDGIEVLSLMRAPVRKWSRLAEKETARESCPRAVKKAGYLVESWAIPTWRSGSCRPQ